jgi:hypothetical protein
VVTTPERAVGEEGETGAEIGRPVAFRTSETTESAGQYGVREGRSRGRVGTAATLATAPPGRAGVRRRSGNALVLCLY